MVFTVRPLFFSNSGTSTSSRPESWVLVVVERMTMLDCARVGLAEADRRPMVANQSTTIHRAIMTRLHESVNSRERGVIGGRRSASICIRQHTGSVKHSQRGGSAHTAGLTMLFS